MIVLSEEMLAKVDSLRKSNKEVDRERRLVSQTHISSLANTLCADARHISTNTSLHIQLRAFEYKINILKIETVSNLKLLSCFFFFLA